MQSKNGNVKTALRTLKLKLKLNQGSAAIFRGQSPEKRETARMIHGAQPIIDPFSGNSQNAIERTLVREFHEGKTQLNRSGLACSQSRTPEGRCSSQWRGGTPGYGVWGESNVQSVWPG